MTAESGFSLFIGPDLAAKLRAYAESIGATHGAAISSLLAAAVRAQAAVQTTPGGSAEMSKPAGSPPRPGLMFDPSATVLDLVDLRDQTLAQLEGLVTAFNDAALAAADAGGEAPAIPSPCWWVIRNHVELLREIIVALDARGLSPEPSMTAGGAV